MTLLTGTFQRADGSPLDGTITFTPTPTALVNATADEIVIPQPVVAFLVNGSFSVELVATDDAAYSPVDWVYTVEERFYQGRTYTIQVEGAGPLDLADLVPPASWAGADFSIVMTGSLSLLSSFDGGEDTTDSTSRLNLYSYQRAAQDDLKKGENIRHFLMKKDAKSMDTWAFPEGGYDVNRDPVGDFKSVVWAGAHWEANNHASNHKHWSVETPDSTGSIETRFEIRFGDVDVDDAIAGLNRTLIGTNLADFVFRASNGQVFRVAAPQGSTSAKVIEFSNDSQGVGDDTTPYRRWRVQVDASSGETGSNAGSFFRIRAYDDAGTFLGNAMTINRTTGQTTFGEDSAYRGGIIVHKNTTAGVVQATCYGAGGTIFLGVGLDTASRLLAGNITGEAQARVVVGSTGLISWGSGAGATDTTLYRSSADVLKTDDSFKTGASVTGSRPAAATAGAGAQWYDTTLQQPIWSNGTVWRDALGTTV